MCDQALFLLATQSGGWVIPIPAPKIQHSSWQFIVIAITSWHSSREQEVLTSAGNENILLLALTWCNLSVLGNT